MVIYQTIDIPDRKVRLSYVFCMDNLDLFVRYTSLDTVGNIVKLATDIFDQQQKESREFEDKFQTLCILVEKIACVNQINEDQTRLPAITVEKITLACLKLMKSDIHNGAIRKDCSNILISISIVNENWGKVIYDEMTEIILSFVKDDATNTQLPVNAISILSQMVQRNACPVPLSSLCAFVHKVLPECGEKEAGYLIGSLISTLFEKLPDEAKLAFGNAILERTLNLADFNMNMNVPAVVERQLLIICGISTNVFLSESFDSELHQLLQSDKFWKVVQAGFNHPNTLSRKRSLFLIKVLVDVSKTRNMSSIFNLQGDNKFWWSKKHEADLIDAWECFILLIETLEEKQVHILVPILPRTKNLVQKASLNDTGQSYIHTSWVTTLFERFHQHESAYIRRCGIIELLDSDMRLLPFEEHKQTGFFSKNFVYMLTDTSLFHKTDKIALGDRPLLVDSLVKFLKSIAEGFRQAHPGIFFQEFLESVSLCKWSGASLVYLLKALAEMKQENGLLNKECMASFITILRSSANSLHVKFRGPIEQFSAIFIMHSLEQRSVDIWDWAGVLGVMGSHTLRRGTHFWNSLVTWLSLSAKNSEYARWNSDHIINTLSSKMEIFIKKDTCDENWVTTWSRLLLLAVDTKIISLVQSEEQKASLETIVAPVLNMAASLGTHAYISIEKAYRTVNVLTALIAQAKPLKDPGLDSVWLKMKAFFSETLCKSILQFIVRLLDEEATSDLYKSINTYVEFLLAINTLNPSSLVGSNDLGGLVDCCGSLLSSSKTASYAKYGSMLVLAGISRCLMASEQKHKNSLGQEVAHKIANITIGWEINHALMKKDAEDAKLDEKDSIPRGLVLSNYLDNQWTCIVFYLQHSTSSTHCVSPDMAVFSNHCVNAFDVVANSGLSSVLRAVRIVIPSVDDSLRSRMIQLSWRKIQEEVTLATFWKTYRSFVEILEQDCIMSAGPDTDTHTTVIQIFEDIFLLGEDKEGLVTMLVQSMCCWCLVQDENIANAAHFADYFVKALMFGPTHSKGKRYENEVRRYLLSLGDELALNQTSIMLDMDDCMTRIHALTLLSRLQVDNKQHALFALSLTEKLLSEQRRLVKLNSYKQFPNSAIHRQKHRVFIGILILQPWILNDDSSVAELLQFLIETLHKEYQYSVRCQAEFLLQSLVARHPIHAQSLLDYLEKPAAEKKPVFTCSIISVITQLAKLFDGERQINFIMQVIPLLLPWATMNQYSVRSFAHGALYELWNLCKTKQLKKVLEQFAVLESFMHFTENHPRSAKILEVIQDKLIFRMNAIRDYSIQTLVFTLPRLCGLSDDEWLQLAWFERAEPWEVPRHHIPLANGTTHLEQCSSGSWKIKNFGLDNENCDNTEGAGDVQKKLIPWIGMLPSLDLEQDHQDTYAQQRTRTNPIIVVASLVDKIPNLGGLCRTSEIFGVNEFIIGSLRYLDDSGFKQLSMTADKWLPIREIKIAELRHYMLEMKNEGYTLVGAEQTANSVCLTQYTFPEKTLLLLGHEGRGIPVDLIQLLDVCVEIPQQGLIRSLNVHVSGALLIWEYTRQQLMKSASTQ